MITCCIVKNRVVQRRKSYSTLVNSIRLFLGFTELSVPTASPSLLVDPELFPLPLATMVTGEPGALARGVGGACPAVPTGKPYIPLGLGSDGALVET